MSQDDLDRAVATICRAGGREAVACLRRIMDRVVELAPEAPGARGDVVRELAAFLQACEPTVLGSAISHLEPAAYAHAVAETALRTARIVEAGLELEERQRLTRERLAAMFFYDYERERPSQNAGFPLVAMPTPPAGPTASPATPGTRPPSSGARSPGPPGTSGGGSGT